MPIRRQTAQFRGGRRQRAPSTWSRFVDNAETLVISSKILLGVFTLNNPGIGETIRRTRGIITVRSDNTAALEFQVGAFGLVVVNDLAAGVGASAIPGPVTDASDDGWFVWQPIAQASWTGISGAAEGHVYEFDSKAMRRVEQGFQVAVMVEQTSGALSGFEIMTNFSMLTTIS